LVLAGRPGNSGSRPLLATHSRPDSAGTTPPHSPSKSGGPSIHSVLPSVVIDGLLPFLTYVLLTSYVPRFSQVVALGLSANFPRSTDSSPSRAGATSTSLVPSSSSASWSALSRRAWRPEAAAHPRILRHRALGVVCLTSLVWPRSLMFYIGRQFSVGGDPAKIAEFNALWQAPAGSSHLLRDDPPLGHRVDRRVRAAHCDGIKALDSPRSLIS
jgi:hypothetical protein